ncbi:hypothetical protein ABPG77_001768, partial [Micractinium sp. CCAP 211/92]
DLGLVDRLPRLVCAQAQTTPTPLYQAYKAGYDNFKPVKGGPRPPLPAPSRSATPCPSTRAVLALRETDGIVEEASEEELMDAAARADLTACSTAPHTGVALSALTKLRGARRHRARLKFAQSKVAYHSKEIEGIVSRYANPPVLVKESAGAVMDAIRAKFPSV